jgi:hypothetical protein
VTIFFPAAVKWVAWTSVVTRSAVACWSGEFVNIAERYSIDKPVTKIKVYEKLETYEFLYHHLGGLQS